MSVTVGDYLLERLATWGVKRIYGYPGDGINGLMGAFQRSSNGERPEFIQVRHEEMAAFMACAHAKFEAGPFWDPDRDWVSDEAGSHDLYWTEERIIGG
jgi:pyruvate dehydrogenase (quinone)